MLVSRASLIVADAIVAMLTFAGTRGQYRTQDVLHVYGRVETVTSVMYTSGEYAYLPTIWRNASAHMAFSVGAIYFVYVLFQTSERHITMLIARPVRSLTVMNVLYLGFYTSLVCGTSGVPDTVSSD